MIKWVIILIYFVATSLVRKKYGDENYADDFLKKCDKPVATRIGTLFFFVILPNVALLIFAAINYHIYRKRTLEGCTTPRLLTISQCAMIIKSLWLLVGFTIWGSHNIVYIIVLINQNCMKNRSVADRFWLADFYILTLFGLLLAILTLIGLPLFVLYKCYEQTERQNESNPYGRSSFGGGEVSQAAPVKYLRSDNMSSKQAALVGVAVPI